MKLVKSYNIPGGSIKLYQEAGSLSARLSIQLIQHAQNKKDALNGLAKQATELANNVMECLDKNHIDIEQDMGRPLSASVAQLTNKIESNIKERRDAWKREHQPMPSNQDIELENPYQD